MSRHRVMSALPLAALAASVALTGTAASASRANRAVVFSASSPSSNNLIEKIALSPAASPIEQMRFKLLQDYPNNFGGIYQTPDGTLAVVEVGSSATFETAARAEGRDLASAFPQAPSDAPAISFTPGVHTFGQLLSTRDAIAANWSTVEPAGVWGVGLDDATGHVTLEETGTPQASAKVSELTAQYGADVFRVEVGPQPVGADATRYADSAPWNGGDFLNFHDTQNGLYYSCTSGFGMHDATTHTTYTLSAGHCSAPGYTGTQPWFNTDFNHIVYNHQFGTVLSGTQYVTGGTDQELIAPSGGSSCIVWGKTSTDPNNVTRYYITNYDDPPVNASVLTEGSRTFEQAATVTSYDMQVTYPVTGYGNITVTDADKINTSLIAGDSGGPVVYPSIYGKLAGGTILATSGSNGFFELIDDAVFTYSVQFGHTFTVNTSPNGTSC